MLSPELSICIVNWNGGEFLRQCLNSVRQAQADLSVETIVVDNGSQDGSPEMAATEFPWVILICNKKNEGFSKANNQAAAISTGRFLLFLNNDTVLSQDCLRAMRDFMVAHPEVGMAGPRLIGRDGRPQRSYRYRPTLAALLHRLTVFRWTGLFRRAYEQYRRREFDPNRYRQVEALLGAAVCLPRQVFLDHGGWDERFPFGLEDFDLSARVGQTHQVAFFPGAELIHFSKTGSRKNAGFVFTGIECGYARYLRKHVLGPASVWIYKLLVTFDLPLALGIEAIRSAWGRIRHGPAEIGRPHSELGSLWYFSTRGLLRFWRA